MFRVLRGGARLCDGLSRREWLRIGGVGLGGLTLPRLLQSQAHAGQSTHRATAKSVIVLFNLGGSPQHETWDPKPDAPAEIRGDFKPIATRTPGLFVSELMPLTANLTDKIAVIRTMVTGDNSHSSSGYQMLTGMPHIPIGLESARPGKPNDWPSYNALVQALRAPQNGLPASISLPRPLANNGGQDPWPGTDAGFLGKSSNPWFLDIDPSLGNFRVGGSELTAELTDARFHDRLSLLRQLGAHLDALERQAVIQNYNRYQEQAINLIAGGRARTAFDLSLEPDYIRERYGRTPQGQSVLLARRLVEAGVSLVQVNWAQYNKKLLNNGSWDTHEKHAESLKTILMPVQDQIYSALIEDLDVRGLLRETLVCLVSEFGHTPRINARAGRDHWGRVFSISLAGGGIQGGIIHGATDAHAAEPITDPVPPCDYLATVFHCLGFEPDTMVHDIENRPIPISRGKVIQSLLA